MSIKFNIYYAVTPKGPWTLANDTPLDRVESGNEFTVSGLRENTLYYINIVGGILNSQGDFLPLVSQAIGPNSSGAGDVNTSTNNLFVCSTFSPPIINTSQLCHQFEIV